MSFYQACTDRDRAAAAHDELVAEDEVREIGLERGRRLEEP
jgi:hypothetical protein